MAEAEELGPKKSYPWRRLLGASWRLARPFWFSAEGYGAWGLLGLVVFLALLEVYLSVQFNTWYKNFYDALQKYDQQAFWALIRWFSFLAACYILQGVFNRYFMQDLQNRWRRWMTRRYLDQWLSDKSHYLWQLADNTTDNPDQRIAEDIRDFTSQSLDLSVGLLNQVVSLFSFVTILWTLSGPLAIPLGGGRSVSLPGYMAWVCLVYAVAGTWASHKVGKPLIGLNYRQQRYEANFRFGLVRLRENGESVAFSEGEQVENLSLREHFEWVYRNFRGLITKGMHFNFLSVGYDQIAVIFPFLVSAPRYFAKALSLGNVLQVVNSFGQVKDALSWVVQNYPTLAYWSSVVERLDGFEAEIGRTKEMHRAAMAVLGPSPDAGAVVLEGLALSLPGRDRPLTPAMSMEFAAGRSILISGPSGCGKSTLLRAMRGLWPFATGRILLPEGASVMVLPQSPYLPVGSLRGALTYPAAETAFEEARILEALSWCRLEHLKDQLSVPENWGLILSVGERQRVAWARVFLHRPQWLFLDEATSALDEASQDAIYAAVREHLPQATMISVAHSQNPRERHQGLWEFGKGAA